LGVHDPIGMLATAQSDRFAIFLQDSWTIANRFTLNIGVYYPEVAELHGLTAEGKYPREYESTLRVRIGTLMPGGHDHWWEVRGGSDLAENRRALHDYCHHQLHQRRGYKVFKA